MNTKLGLRSEFWRKMSSDLLSGCLQNQIQLLALEIGKNIKIGLGWVVISEVLWCHCFEIESPVEVSDH